MNTPLAPGLYGHNIERVRKLEDGRIIVWIPEDGAIDESKRVVRAYVVQRAPEHDKDA
jgi:hypothetical protein